MQKKRVVSMEININGIIYMKERKKNAKKLIMNRENR